ncbi:hypothetical protein SY88_18965 [Clostridiales bacterium PH28_bin88]|nr:hypothetical protein SY88_18965 [Clostridiales bacterium PH28_bin88]
MIWRQIKKQHTSLSGELLLNMFFFYLVALMGVTIFPIPLGIPCYGDYFHANFIPFKSILGSLHHSWYMVALRNIGGNLVLLAPFGFLLPMIRKDVNTLGKVVATGFLLSLSIELVQLMLPGRAADVDDLILNTLGLLFGFLAFKLLGLLQGLIPKRQSSSDT